MTGPIPPALSEEDRADLERYGVDDFCEARAFQGEWAKVIAAANAELPDSDPRKITRAMVVAIQAGACAATTHYGEERDEEVCRSLSAIAAVLASYLPPGRQ